LICTIYMAFSSQETHIMIHPLPQMASVSDLKHRHLEILKRLDKGPVVLANRSQPIGVLISPRQWDDLAERIDNLEALILALQAELSVAQGNETLEDIDVAALKAELQNHVASEMDK
jgi:prevent-host-death family protein